MSEDKLSHAERKNIMDKFNRALNKNHDSYEEFDISDNISSDNIDCLIIPKNPAINDKSLLDLNNRSNGEVAALDIINYRTGMPKPEGIFSEIIFGPINDSEARKTMMGHIDLKYNFLNPLFRSLCGKLSAIAGNGGMSGREIERLLREGYNVNKVANSTTIQEIKDFIEHTYDNFLNSKTLTERGHSSTIIDIKVFSNFYVLGINPSRTIINKVPVIPAWYRPYWYTQDGRLMMASFNEHYKRILRSSTKLKRQVGIPPIILKQFHDPVNEKLYSYFYGGYYYKTEDSKEYFPGLSEFFSFERFIKPKITTETIPLLHNIKIQKSNSVDLFEIGLPRLIQQMLDSDDKKFVNKKTLLFNVGTNDFTNLQAFTIKIVDTDYIQIHPFFYNEFSIKNKININLPLWDIKNSHVMLYNLISTLFISQQFNKLHDCDGNYKGR